MPEMACGLDFHFGHMCNRNVAQLVQSTSLTTRGVQIPSFLLTIRIFFHLVKELTHI